MILLDKLSIPHCVFNKDRVVISLFLSCFPEKENKKKQLSLNGDLTISGGQTHFKFDQVREGGDGM